MAANVAAAQRIPGGPECRDQLRRHPRRRARAGQGGADAAAQLPAPRCMVNLVGSFNVAKAAAALMQHNAAGDGRRARRDRQHRRRGRLRRPDRPGRVLGIEGRRGRHDPADGARTGAFRHPRDDHRPGHLLDADGRRHARRKCSSRSAASIPFPSRLGQPEEFADLVAYILGNPTSTARPSASMARCAWRRNNPLGAGLARDAFGDIAEKRRGQGRSYKTIPHHYCRHSNESPRHQERQRRRTQRHRVPGARHRAQLRRRAAAATSSSASPCTACPAATSTTSAWAATTN